VINCPGKSTEGTSLPVVALNLATHIATEIIPASGGIGGPADFSISRDGQYFIIPAMIEGKVLIEKRAH